MRRQVMIWAACLVAAVVMVLPAHSQSMLRADVPFGFNVGDKWMPAGEYEVVMMNQHLTLIRSRDGEASAFKLTIPNRPRNMEYGDDARLVFHRYGSRYFLSEIHTPWSGMKHVLPKSSLEQELVAGEWRRGEVTMAYQH